MKIIKVNKRWLTILLSVLSTAGVQAQEVYNPENPPDPLMLFKVTVSAEPAEAGYVSGEGRYAEGDNVNLSTSIRNNDYEFLYWKQDGVQIDSPRNFSYTMGNNKTSFVAVYGYNPKSPQDPTAANNYRLYVNTDAEGSCTFNIANGTKFKADQYINVAAQNISPGFVFLGWYADGQKVSSSASFNYLMPYKDVTLTASLVYDPVSPDDPVSSGDPQSIANGKSGDVNGDGVVNVADAVLLINHYLNGTTGELTFTRADVNRDIVINVSDAVEIINRYLNNQ